MVDISTTAAAINMTHPSVPAGTPASIFQSERFDKPAGANLLWDFPVTAGEYEVRLYFAETYSGAFAVGVRQFDVMIEGVRVLNDYDIFAEVGANKAVVKSFVVTSDANLDVDFLREVQNPAIKAIEILTVDGTNVEGEPPTISGDFNGDGAVDGTDFLQWQRQLGDGTTQSDVDKLEAWKANFGRITAPTAAESAIEAFATSALARPAADPRFAGLALKEPFQRGASKGVETQLASVLRDDSDGFWTMGVDLRTWRRATFEPSESPRSYARADEPVGRLEDAAFQEDDRESFTANDADVAALDMAFDSVL